MKKIKSTDARNNFQALVDKIHFSREVVVITKHNKPWVVVKPLKDKDISLEKLIKEEK